jgi:hypothetical protein
MKKLLLLLSLLLLAGCGELVEFKTTVINKYFEPAWSETVKKSPYRFDCGINFDFEYVCDLDWFINEEWKEVHHPARYYLILRGDGCTIDQYKVDQGEYVARSEGDTVTVTMYDYELERCQNDDQ